MKKKEFEYAELDFNEHQLMLLMESFKKRPYASKQQKDILAKKLQTTHERINEWFANQRDEENREGKLQCQQV